MVKAAQFGGQRREGGGGEDPFNVTVWERAGT
jgi:hypothetical protein